MRTIPLLLFLLSAGGWSFCHGQTLFRKQAILMGSRFEITVVGDDSIRAYKEIARVIAEVTRIENLISEWRPDTQISEVNRNAGVRAVKVDREVFDLTKRAVAYAGMTQGAFDITVAAMDRIWRFDGSMTEMPSQEMIRKSVESVGYQHIVLDSIHSTIYLARAGMKIGFGSIGKGYAADKGRELMLSSGVQGGIVNASGDLSAWGARPGNKAWVVGISHPLKRHKIVKTFRIKQASVATSGDYAKYAEIDGVRYSHILNPKTGYPAAGLSSVTVIGPSAEMANALSTSVMVLGGKAGVALLKRFPRYRFVCITSTGKVLKG